MDATRLATHKRKVYIRSLCEAGIATFQKHLLALDDATGNGFAARCDPRTITVLSDMAERHRRATLMRSFLQSLSEAISDRTVLVADYTLDEWMVWAAAQVEEFDPLSQGPTKVFETLVKP